MKNLIEYLMLFVIVLLFCPNNFWTFGLCVCSLLIYLLYLICYFKYKKNNKEEKVKQPIEMDFIISIVMIVALNLINKIGVVNLAYGYALVAIFLAHLIKNTIITPTSPTAYKGYSLSQFIKSFILIPPEVLYIYRPF